MLAARHRAVLLAAGAIGLSFLFSAPADARLRSPRLSSSCASGYTYGEVARGGWLVEGCTKAVRANENESARIRFNGPVEVNGLLITGSRPLFLTQRTSPGRLGVDFVHRIERAGSARIDINSKIGGRDRNFTIYRGAVAMEVRSSLGREPPRIQTTGGTIDLGQASSNFDAPPRGQTTLPVGSGFTVLGMRLAGGRIPEVKVDDGTLEFRTSLSFGSGTTPLLRDWVARTKIKTVDGRGMELTGLRFKIPDIEIPGLGGFRNLDIGYSSSRDEWSGGVFLDLGDILPSIDFDMSVSAATGVPTSIRSALSNLNLPLGASGIVLQGARAGFVFNPLTFSGGVTASVGPRIAGQSLILIDGDLTTRLENGFRLEATGRARVLPAGNGELATGTLAVILDSNGYLSIGGNARFRVAVLGAGIEAEFGGRGAYATDRNRFNIEAYATGSFVLGDWGRFEIARAEAVVSSEGFGACARVLAILSGGVGQRWGDNFRFFLGCDLGRFRTQVPHARLASAPPGAAGETTFTLPAGVERIAVSLTAGGPDPRVALTGPAGNTVVVTGGMRQMLNDNLGVIAPENTWANQPAVIAVRNPPAGTYRVRWPAGAPPVTDVKVAQSLPPFTATASVTRVAGQPGVRRLQVTGVGGLDTGEVLQIGVRGPNGVFPIGEVAPGGTFSQTFPEQLDGQRQIIAAVLRDGMPVPGRARVIGTYAARNAQAPGSIVKSRKKNVVRLLARPRAGAELPQAWQYVARAGGTRLALARARPGRRVTLTLPPGTGAVRVVVRPVVGGRPLRVARTETVSVDEKIS